MKLDFYLTYAYQPSAETIEMARHAEEFGFHGLAAGEHLFYPIKPSTRYPYTESGEPPFSLDKPWPDVWVMAGAIGVTTSKLHFRTNVYVLPLRHPLIVARAVGTAAAMAEGRIELGVGVGHLGDEFTALDVDFQTRGRRIDESISALRSLLKAGPVSHHGKIWNIGPIYLHPAPEQPVPIFVGGESKAALERTARLGDGYISIPHSMEDLEALMAELKRLRAALAPERPPLRFHLHGSDLRTLGDYRRLADAGAEAVTVAFWLHGRRSPVGQGLVERMKDFSESVIEKI